MSKSIKIKAILTLAILTTMPASLYALEKETFKDEFQPMVIRQFLEKAKENTDWKTAFVTGKQEQIVFMNISPLTNPDNEIGMEVHPFDQVIYIVEGDARAILNGKTSTVNSGDLIFVPQGTQHNVINLGKERPLKVISFYSENDMPKGETYKKKADQPA